MTDVKDGPTAAAAEHFVALTLFGKSCETSRNKRKF